MDNWISVDDRLPKEDEIVFIFCKGYPKNLNHRYTHLKNAWRVVVEYFIK